MCTGGVKYFVLGGGGAEQDPILPGRTHIKVPEGYPLDQYWKGEAPKEDYNYLHVEVRPGQAWPSCDSHFSMHSIVTLEDIRFMKECRVDRGLSPALRSLVELARRSSGG